MQVYDICGLPCVCLLVCGHGTQVEDRGQPLSIGPAVKPGLVGYRLVILAPVPVSNLLVWAIWDYRCCTPTCSFYLGSGDLKARKDMQFVKRCIASYAILKNPVVIPSQPVSPLFSYKSLIVLKWEINLSWRAPGLLAGLEAQWRFSFNKNQVLE